MAKLAEKMAGGRRQDRVLWEGQGRKGNFIGGLGKVAIIFSKEEALNGGQFEALFQKLQSFSICKVLYHSHHTDSALQLCKIFIFVDRGTEAQGLEQG